MDGGRITRVVEAIERDPQWLEEALAIIKVRHEIERVRQQRRKVQGRLRRTALSCVDGLFSDKE